jgi:O-antigen/teichoic acid export membrane protein
VRRWAKDGLSAVIDQTLSSGTNFATGLIAARLLGPERFGLVVVAMSAVYLSVAMQRALVGEPLLAQIPLLTPPAARSAERDALSTAAGIGILSGLACLAVARTPLSMTRDLWLVALWVPGIILQDAVRYVSFGRRRPNLAAASDGAWTLGQGIVLLLLMSAGEGRSAANLLAAWGFGGVIGAGVGIWRLGISPLGGRPRQWLIRSRRLSAWLLPQTLLSQGAFQLSTMMVGLLLGSDAVAGFRVLLTLVMPILATITVADALLVPSMAVTLQASGADAQAALVRSLALKAGLLAGAAAVMLIAYSDFSIRVLFGIDYVRFHGLVPALAIAMTLHAFGLPAGSGLRALQEGRRLFTCQLATNAIGLPATLLLSATFGLGGAVWSVTLQAAVMMVITSMLYRSAIRERRGNRRASHWVRDGHECWAEPSSPDCSCGG